MCVCLSVNETATMACPVPTL